MFSDIYSLYFLVNQNKDLSGKKVLDQTYKSTKTKTSQAKAAAGKVKAKSEKELLGKFVEELGALMTHYQNLQHALYGRMAQKRQSWKEVKPCVDKLVASHGHLYCTYLNSVQTVLRYPSLLFTSCN